MNALKRIGIWFFALKMYGIIHRSDTSKYIRKLNKTLSLSYTGRTASIKERSLILRLNGLLLNENPGGSNSIRVRTSKA
jgi:hypothetical protein